LRWIIVLVGLGMTACGEMSEPGLGESMALAQASTAWQDEKGNVLPPPLVEQAYRACQASMFRPGRASVAMAVPLEDEYSRLALTNPELDVCMNSFGYSRAASPSNATRGTD
jgi:hypothetical protein